MLINVLTLWSVFTAHNTLAVEGNSHHVFPLDWKTKRGEDERGTGIEKRVQKF
jgi:hypothetical protein